MKKSINILRYSPSNVPDEKQVPRKTGYYQHNLYFSNFKEGDKVIIVDDIISIGGTLITIIDTLLKLNVKIIGIQAIYAKTQNYKRIEERYKIPIKVLEE
jgi:adenine phosphoribosyltransferase